MFTSQNKDFFSFFFDFLKLNSLNYIDFKLKTKLPS